MAWRKSGRLGAFSALALAGLAAFRSPPPFRLACVAGMDGFAATRHAAALRGEERGPSLRAPLPSSAGNHRFTAAGQAACWENVTPR